MIPIPILPSSYGDFSTITSIFSGALSANDSGDAGFTLRTECILTGGGGRRIRATFTASTVAAYGCNNVSIGISKGSAGDTVGIPIELFFNGASGFALAANTSITSDWLNFPCSVSDVLTVIQDINVTQGNPRSGTNGHTYYKASAASYNLATVAGLTDGGAGFSLGLSSIEVQ